jgi:hypothetical protein
MVYKIIIFIFILVYWSCTQTKNNSSKNTFLYSPIKDTSLFIKQLKLFANLEIDESNKIYEKINFYKKIHLYGSSKEYIFIEYDYGNGVGSAFPYKYQILIDNQGYLIKKLSGLKFRFIKVFPNENPLLILTLSTSKGNGWHEIYQIIDDSLVNIYDGYEKHFIRTYDAHQDGFLFQPSELDINIKDYNKDGMNDICFEGVQLNTQNQKKDSVRFIFLYQEKNKRFGMKNLPSKRLE